MNEYEITYLANPRLDESAKNQLDENIDKIIAKSSGEISFSSPTDSPGSRRRLHYPIHDQKVAWVRVLQAQVDPKKIRNLRAALTKHENIMRVSILQTDRREEISPELLNILNPAPKTQTPKTAKPDQPKKEVTMKEVEAGIEEALDEEVK